VPKTLQIH